MLEITNQIKLIIISSILLIISGIIEDIIPDQANAPFDSTTAAVLFLLGAIGIAYAIFSEDI